MPPPTPKSPEAMPPATPMSTKTSHAGMQTPADLRPRPSQEPPPAERTRQLVRATAFPSRRRRQGSKVPRHEPRDPARDARAGGRVEGREVGLEIEHGGPVDRVEAAHEQALRLDGDEGHDRDPDGIGPVFRALREDPELRHLGEPARAADEMPRGLEGRTVQEDHHHHVGELVQPAQARAIGRLEHDPRLDPTPVEIDRLDDRRAHGADRAKLEGPGQAAARSRAGSEPISTLGIRPVQSARTTRGTSVTTTRRTDKSTRTRATREASRSEGRSPYATQTAAAVPSQPPTDVTKNWRRELRCESKEKTKMLRRLPAGRTWLRASTAASR